MSEPMDTERLSAVRVHVDGLEKRGTAPLIRALLSAHDYWQAIGGDMLGECAKLRARTERSEKREAELVAMVAEQRKQRDYAQRLCLTVQADGFADLCWATNPPRRTTSTTSRPCSGPLRATVLFGEATRARLYPEEPDASDPGQPNMPGRSAMCAFEHLGPCDCHACAAFKAANS